MKLSRSPLILLFGFLACSTGDGGVKPDTGAGMLATMEAAGGTDQEGVVGQELPLALTVVLEDANGRGIPDRTVTFVVTSGGGSMFVGSSVSTADGRAADRWTLGTSIATPQRAEARIVDPESGQGFVVKFSARARGGPPVEVVRVAGEGQIGAAATALDDSLGVEVRDRYGNPVQDVAVTWTVASGGGAVAPATSTTGEDGVARTRWTLGPLEGVPQEVTATAGSLSPVSFHASFIVTSTVPVWESVASMPYAVRSAAAATDGQRIYVFGGSDPTYRRTAWTQVFDPASGTWTLGKAMPVALDFVMAVGLSDGIHVLGGATDAGVQPSHWIYDPAADSWSVGPSLVRGVGGSAAQVVDGKVYLVAGVRAISVYDDIVQVYDPASGTWTTTASYPTPMLSAGSAVLGGKLLVVGGGVPTYQTTAQQYAYDPATRTWAAMASLPAAREAMASGVSNGRFCVAGGRLARAGRFNTPHADTWCFDPAAGTWEAEPSIPTPRAEMASVTLDGWIYAIGGHGSVDIPTTTVERFRLDGSAGSAGVLLQQGFESGLGAWTGQDYNPTSAEVVPDPLGTHGMVVHFTRTVARGDLFSEPVTVSPSGQYKLTFDYLGIPESGSTPGNLGGFVGISDGRPGTHAWLAGTVIDTGAEMEIADDASWHSYEIVFQPSSLFTPSDNRIHVMLEDWEESGPVAGDAYFDNIRLERVGN